MNIKKNNKLVKQLYSLNVCMIVVIIKKMFSKPEYP